MRCDECLKYWGVAYGAVRLHKHGITFWGFIEDPPGRRKALGLASAPVGLESGYRPLLPRQWRVAQELWRRWQEEAN